MSDDRKLPKPVTVSEMYLHDMALTMREMASMQYARLRAAAPSTDSGVEGELLKEPAVDGGPDADASLPEDFPGRAALEAAGITAVADVPRTAKRLRAIDGIGDVTATAILRTLTGK